MADVRTNMATVTPECPNERNISYHIGRSFDLHTQTNNDLTGLAVIPFSNLKTNIKHRFAT